MHSGSLVALGMILMAIFILPSESQQLDFTFTCEGTDSTMASYSYSKEPSLQSSGYTRGFKTGSFNYLENGDIDVKETIKYKYGNGTDERNTSISHNLVVDFNGTRGISEFYGKAFFGNNRAVSAWKKIRYEDLSQYENVSLKYNKTASLGKARTAKNFSVVASVQMNADPDTDYETYTFNYDAKVKDAVIETKDAAGWSNRTGKMRIDFEHDSLMSGEELNITNVLKDSAPFPVEAGGHDWLSCCIGGTEPPYYPPVDNNDDWPNTGTYMTLSPAKLLPTVNRTQKHMIGPDGELRSAGPIYNKFSCNDTNCSGFECIYKFVRTPVAGVESTGAGKRSEFANFTAISVVQTYTTKPTGTNKTEVTYNITVGNSGSTMLKNVTLNDTLPKGMSHDRSSYFDGGSPSLLSLRNTTTGQVVSLSLGNFNTSQYKLVQLVAVYEGVEKAPNYANNKVVVTGEALDGHLVNATSSKAKLDEKPKPKLKGTQ